MRAFFLHSTTIFELKNTWNFQKIYPFKGIKYLMHT